MFIFNKDIKQWLILNEFLIVKEIRGYTPYGISEYSTFFLGKRLSSLDIEITNYEEFAYQILEYFNLTNIQIPLNFIKENNKKEIYSYIINEYINCYGSSLKMIIELRNYNIIDTNEISLISMIFQ